MNRPLPAPHRRKGSVLWLDGHTPSETLKSLGYESDEHKAVTFKGNNKRFNIHHQDKAWVE